MKLLLKRDSRLFSYQHVFGSTSEIAKTLLLDTGSLDIEPIGSVACTVYTRDKIASAETGKTFDHLKGWSDMVTRGKTSSQGASPQDAFSCAVNPGLTVAVSGEVITFPAYFDVLKGIYDSFGNVQSAIQLEYDKNLKRPIGIGSKWYQEWQGIAPNGVMPMGKTPVSGHEWMICGWDEEHGDMFKIDAHQGYYTYMPREVFNATIRDCYGAVGLTLAQTTQEVIDFNKAIKVSVLQKMIDLLYNLWQKLYPQTYVPPMQPTNNQSKIDLQPVINKSKELYDLSFSLIGKHLTMDNTVPKQYGCAQAVSYLFKELGYKTMLAYGISSTQELEKWLDQTCTEVQTPQVGDIIISVSYTGTPGARGHVGVVGKEAIMSNDSDTGLWEPYWSLAGWLPHYRDELKLRTRYFRL